MRFKSYYNIPDVAILTCANSNFPAITLNSSESYDTVFSGFTVTCCNLGAYIGWASPTMQNMVFSQNQGTSNVEVYGNTLTLYTGAVYHQGQSFAQFINCEFSNNTGNYLAGVYVDGSSLAGVRNAIVTISNSE